MPARSRELRHDDGAVLIIVVLLLVALMGMMVLVIDVGNLLYRRVAVQNSADSAALAAAISCAGREGPIAASSQAEYYASANMPATVVMSGFPSYFPDCHAPSGTVTVRVRLTQDLFFAPTIGAGDEATITTEATASWGGAIAANHLAPLMLSARRLSDCQIPPANPEILEATCAFFWDNSPAASSSPALTNAEWGTLDLLKWDVIGTAPGPIAKCDNSTPPQFEEWMFEGYTGYLGINAGDPDLPTYVCRGQGNFGAALDKLINKAIALGNPAPPAEPLYLYFPVNQPLNQVDKNGVKCIPPDLLPDPTTYTSCTVDKYDIIGFARLKITALYKKQDPEMVSLCTSRIPGAVPTANSRCILVEWVDYTNEGLPSATSGENFGVVPVTLIK